ncbi:hypothetical protein ACFVU4_34790 [Streptomyces sp. NPDC058107]
MSRNEELGSATLVSSAVAVTAPAPIRVSEPISVAATATAVRLWMRK